VIITGTATQGQTLTASNTLADADGLGAITYNWLRDGANTGSTGSAYVLGQADVGKKISAQAVYTDLQGTTEAVSSTQTAAVIKLVNSNIVGTSKDDALYGAGGNDTLTGLGGSDNLFGGDGNDVLYGDAATVISFTLPGNDRYSGGLGNDVLFDYSTISSDTYNWGKGLGVDTLTDNGGAADKLVISGGMSATQVWLSHLANSRDLQVALIGTADRFVVKNWYASTWGNKPSTGAVETLQLEGGLALASTKVQSLVDAMASFSTAVPSTSTLPVNAPKALTDLIATSWV
jgi:Ca2+-binding RTX toxin-like protein